MAILVHNVTSCLLVFAKCKETTLKHYVALSKTKIVWIHNMVHINCDFEYWYNGIYQPTVKSTCFIEYNWTSKYEPPYKVDMCKNTPTIGRVLPYLDIVGRFFSDAPWFRGLSVWLGPYFIPPHDPNGPLFLQKKSVCLYHI